MIFESFSVIQRQISLGVHSYAVVHFPCLTKKFFKNRDFGTFRRYCVKFHSEYSRTLLFIFLVLRKNPSKIENRDFWVFAVTLGQMSLGVPTVRRRSFSLSYEKILQKSRLWVFSVILRQISLGVHSYAAVHFPCLTKKSSKNRDLGLFGDTATNITRSTFACCRLFSDRTTKCVTRFTFNTNFNLCHSSG